LFRLRVGLLFLAGMLIAYSAGYISGGRHASDTEKVDEPLEIEGDTLENDDYFGEVGVFPDQISDFVLSRQIKGSQAAQLVAGFMGENIPVESCYVPYYRGEETDIVLWAVKLDKSPEATELFQLMKERLKENAYFKNKEILTLEEASLETDVEKIPEVACVELKDQQNPFYYHFFYYRENWVFWMMADNYLDKEQVFKFYHAIPSS